MSASDIDALPYYDKQIDDPSLKAAARALIDAELRSTPQISPEDPRIPPRAEIFSKSKELADLLDGYPEHPIRGIDTSKFGVPRLEDNATLEEMVEAEQRGRIGLGHMALRHENIDLLSSYGPNAWLVRNYQLNSQLTELQQALEGLKERVTEVNRSRRVAQEETGTHLTRLEGRWQDLVGATVQLEMACVAMEGEVRGLRSKEDGLRKEVEALEAQA